MYAAMNFSGNVTGSAASRRGCTYSVIEPSTCAITALIRSSLAAKW